MRKIVYRASDTRHGLFADLRKLVEWRWLAREIGDVDIELRYQKYDAERSDVDGFVRNIAINNPTYDPAIDGERMRRKFMIGVDPLRALLGIDLSPVSREYDEEIVVDNARVSDHPDLLDRWGVHPASLLRRELQNTPSAYTSTTENQFIRWRCHEELTEMVTLRPETQAKVDAFRRRHLADAPHVLAAHVRWSDHYLGTPYFPTDDDYYSAILEDLARAEADMTRESGGRPVILLATHLGGLIERAADRWRDQIVFTDIARSGWNEDYFFVDEKLEAQLEAAIVDCWLLATADVLVGGVSNLAFTALTLEPELPFRFLDTLAGSRGG